MRVTFYMKIFILCALFTILVVIHISVRQLQLKYGTINSKVENSAQEPSTDTYEESASKEQVMKYILQWTSPKNVPFVYMGEGPKGFIDRNCPYTNCFVTSKRDYLGDYSKFDVIAFSGPEVVRMPKELLPKRRSPHQKFAFASIESADYYPVCSNRLDGFFNWTWTYKLDSEAKWGYIVVRDAQNKIIGPKREMHWIKFEDMDPVGDELKNQLKTKTKAAAWFVSNCYSRNGREIFAHKLHDEMKKYNLTLDIYGNCGSLKCPRNEEEKCDEMLKKDYYFYLAFENSFSEDYVTEKLLHGLKHTAVPIVYGAANYTRFMPDGIYLNARELGVEKLAAKMDELIRNPAEYAEYFRWHKYYSYYRRQESLETDDYCRFCSILFEKDMVNKITTYDNFRKWWDPPNRC
ncbi:alpha-(1,3)-fucosyltransferase C-like [Epargyreus clarus]|uniref:alpha-(1,3)-fucosyltransferase C-like n=1 Tax=Epargyreus clarus TaxID=520877 RepID=UPI003C2E7ED9